MVNLFNMGKKQIKNPTLAGSIIALFLICSFVSKAQKLQICHVIAEDQENTRTLEVEHEALRAHFAHGDYLGACIEDEGYYFRLKISPNPYFEKTSISYILYEPAKITMEVYDQIGNLVKTIVDQSQEPGNYSYSFNAEGMRKSAGLHYLKVRRITEKEEYSQFERLVKLQ
ncbi:MAG TPA: hypothetical protein EYM84_08740 [Flavobacteriales bacterium]|nr:hypothetical protein [Flavobacteriales bacterium]